MKIRGYEIKPGADLTDADLTRADLTGVNLTCADLTRANLYGANLRSAILTGAILTHADLTGADLTHADLTRANLTRADLTDADLTGAVLQSCVGNMVEVKTLCIDTWMVTYTKDRLQWYQFNDKTIASMGSEALHWWRKWKDIIKSIITTSEEK
jgi:hypothetical protein